MRPDILYVLVGMLVIWIFLFKREILIREETFKIVLAISAAVSAAGAVLLFAERTRMISAGFLLNPLPSSGLFRLCRRVFLRRYNREPRDTFFDWRPGMAPDRLFNIIYGAGSFWFAGLLAFFAWKLATAWR